MNEILKVSFTLWAAIKLFIRQRFTPVELYEVWVHKAVLKNGKFEYDVRPAYFKSFKDAKEYKKFLETPSDLL